jgi:DNA repair photolyase
MKKLEAIYAPTGPAAEYASLALNIYKGCTHKCIYCYNNGRFGKIGYFFEAARPRKKLTEKLRKDLKYLQEELGPACPEIHLTFLGDAYQPAESSLGLTRMVIRLIIGANLPFTILTKSNLVIRDFDLLVPYKDKFRLGLSLCSINQTEVARWEPGTGYISDRVSALKQFKNMGGRTWVSLEPVMRVKSAIEVIENTYGFVDFYWIGALNHMDPPEPYNLINAQREIMEALEFRKCQYKFKSSFTDA